MENARFTELFDEALKETDFDKRKEKFSIVQDQWYGYFGRQSEEQEVIRRGLEALTSVKKVYNVDGRDDKDINEKLDKKIKFLISKIDVIK